MDATLALNIISLHVLDDIGIPREKIQKQPFEVSSFNVNQTYTVGSISLGLTVGLIRTAHRFHVIDSQMSYHLLLGRPWIHRYKVVPSTYQECLKAIWRGKNVYINATGIPFQRDEAHFSEAQYFDEPAEEGEVIIVQPRGVLLPAWEDLEGNKMKTNPSAQTSMQHPRPSKKQKKGKAAQQEDGTFEKVQLADGRTVYVLWWFMGPDPLQKSGPPNASSFVEEGEQP